MPTGGDLRAKLSDTLSTAYGRGLLSEHTFARRLDSVLHDPVVDPARVTGDLYLRGPESRVRDRVSHTMSTVFARLEQRFGDLDPLAPSLRGLDWTGAIPELLIGRSSRCDVVVGDPTVSRRHARLHFRDGAWVLQDLASTNGTTLNGRRVERCELRPGDTLGLGDLQLRVD